MQILLINNIILYPNPKYIYVKSISRRTVMDNEDNFLMKKIYITTNNYYIRKYLRYDDFQNNLFHLYWTLNLQIPIRF